MNPVTEIVRYIAGSITAARSRRLFAEVLGWEAAQDIAADVVQHERAVGDAAHKSETYDREALRLLDEVLADGVVTPDEVAKLRKAREFASRSAEVDHDITETVALT